MPFCSYPTQRLNSFISKLVSSIIISVTDTRSLWIILTAWSVSFLNNNKTNHVDYCRIAIPIIKQHRGSVLPTYLLLCSQLIPDKRPSYLFSIANRKLHKHVLNGITISFSIRDSLNSTEPVTHGGLISKLSRLAIQESKDSKLSAAGYSQAADLKVYKSCASSRSDSQLPIRQKAAAIGLRAGQADIVSRLKQGVLFVNWTILLQQSAYGFSLATASCGKTNESELFKRCQRSQIHYRVFLSWWCFSAIQRSCTKQTAASVLWILYILHES